MSKETCDKYGQEEYHHHWVLGHEFKPVNSKLKEKPYTPDQDENKEEEDVTNT
jgi:hypothetical protein